MKRAAAILLLMASCRTPVAVDTSGSKFIPREVAAAKLREVLPTAEAVACGVDKAFLQPGDITSWKVDDKGLEIQSKKANTVRLAFAEITEARVEYVGFVYQLRLFTPAEPNPRKDHIHFNWQKVDPARQALEYIEALRQKK